MHSIHAGVRLLAQLGVLAVASPLAAAPGTPVVADEGAYARSLDALSASWSAEDPRGSIRDYQYRITRDTSAGPVIRGWTSVGLATNVTATGLPLRAGATYYVAVRAEFGPLAGRYTDPGYSDGIVADGAAPVLGVVLDDGAYTSSATALHARWTGTDPGTGVARYRYAIGTAPGAIDVRPWTDVQLATEATATGLALAHGTAYYFTVEISDLAGNRATLSSDGIRVDTQAPALTDLADGGDFTRLTSALAVSWSGSDPVSGIAGYRISAGTSPGATDTRPWTQVGLATDVVVNGLSLASGTTYYVNVEARDGAGNTRVASTDGIAVDALAPAITVLDEGATTLDGTTLRAAWPGSDTGSGVTGYAYALGTASDPQAVVPWTSSGLVPGAVVGGLSLGDGVTYYFRVQATDGAGNVGVGVSDGIRADLSAPLVNLVADAGAYQASAETLVATWLATDVGGDIAEYRYAVGTAPGASDTVAWASAGQAQSVTLTGLALHNGRSYYFTVRAFDSAGRMGESHSDGVLVDLADPVVEVVTDGGDYTRDPGSLTFSYAASDGESGIRSYAYAIGTPADLQSVVPWTAADLETTRTVTGLALADGENYIVSVYAYDEVGHVAVGYSDGITPDTSPPRIVFVEDTGTVTALDDRLSVSWQAADDGVGIGGYRYAIGTAPDLSNVHPWTDPGIETSVTVTGLALSPGVVYYFTLRVSDHFGAIASGHTDGIRLDTDPPSVGETRIESLTGTTATVSWTTNKPTEGVVDYGETAGYGAQAADYGFAEAHAVILNLLAPGTTYHYRITASDDAGAAASSEDLVFTTPDEADRHLRLSPEGASYVGLRVLQSEAKATFRLGNGDVWVADLDAAAGGFRPGSDGRDYLMDTGSVTGATVDGPEFGVDASGWAVFYSKDGGGGVQVWTSRWTGGAAEAAALTSGAEHHSVLASRSGYPQVRLVDIIGSWDTGGDLAWYVENAPGQQHVVAPADAALTERDPGHWMSDGVRLVMVDPDTGQLFTLDTSSGVRTDITNDDGFKTAPRAWQAPEYDGATIVAAVVDDGAIAVYRNLGQRYWTRVATLAVPISSNGTVIASPQAFVAGDRSYLVLEIKDRPIDDGHPRNSEIWVFDLEDDGRARHAERCDDGRAPLARSNPAAFVGASDVFVYYNAPSGANATELWMCRTGIALDTPHPIVDTDVGRVQGVRQVGADAFLNIPYAAAPVDDRRWQTTQPVAAWWDVRSANRLPPPCPQPDPERPATAIIGAEDCLYLNVWTPSDRPPGQRLPVMFYVHGGGNRTGSASDPLSRLLEIDDPSPIFDGTELSDRGDAVVVTIQYRLAALGFLAEPALAAGSPTGTAGNYGVFDILEALRWVQRNIAAFGGDPARVLLFGESGGARDVAVLLASQRAAGLYSRALMQSGVADADTPVEALEIAGTFVEEMGLAGVPDLAAQLRGLPLWKIVLADIALPVDYDEPRTFGPHVDGHILEQSPLEVIAAGAHNAVPLILGTNAAEYAMDYHDLTVADFFLMSAELVPPERLAELYALYPLADFASPTEAYVAMVSDRHYTSTTRTLARILREHQAPPVYRYHFRRVLSTDARRADGAYHASELLYLFQHMDGVHFGADDDDRSVETLMLNYWSRFAASGDPNNPYSPAWPVYDPIDDGYMILDVEAAAGARLFEDRCDFWDSIRSDEPLRVQGSARRH